MSHLDALVARIAPERPPGHLSVNRLSLCGASRQVAKDLIHARQFHNQLASRLQHPPPFLQHVHRFPFVEMLQYMNGDRRIDRPRLKRERPEIGYNVGAVSGTVAIDVDPPRPGLMAASELDTHAIARVFQAFATRAGENRTRT